MTLNSWSPCATAGITGMHPHAQAIWNQEIEIICICSLMFLVDNKIELPCCLQLPPTTFPFFLPAPTSTTEKAQSQLQCSPIRYHSPWSITSKRGFFFIIQLSAFSELRLNWCTPSLLNMHQQHYTLKFLVCVFHFLSHKFRQEPSGTDSVVNAPSKPSFLCFQLKPTV